MTEEEAKKVPNTIQIDMLKHEQFEVLKKLRVAQRTRDAAAKEVEDLDRRLMIIDTALEGVSIGIGHAKEAAENAPKPEPKPK